MLSCSLRKNLCSQFHRRINLATWRLYRESTIEDPDNDLLTVAISTEKIDPARDAVEAGNVWKRIHAVGAFADQRFLTWIGDINQWALQTLRQQGHVAPLLILLRRRERERRVMVDWLRSEKQEVSREDLDEQLFHSGGRGAEAFILVCDAWVWEGIDFRSTTGRQPPLPPGVGMPKRRALQVLAAKGGWPQGRCAWRVYSTSIQPEIS